MIPHSLYVYAKIFFESFLVCLSRFMVVSAMSAQHGVYSACGGKGWERNANVLFFRFYLPPCVAAAKGEEDRKEVQTSCSNVIMFPCTPTTQDTWVIDSIFGTPIAPSSSLYSLDVFYTIQYLH